LFRDNKIGDRQFSMEEIQDSSFSLLRHFGMLQNVAMQLDFEVPGEDAHLTPEGKKYKQAKKEKDKQQKQKKSKSKKSQTSSWSEAPIRPLYDQSAMCSGDILVSHPISNLDPDTKIFDRSVVMVVNGVSVGEGEEPAIGDDGEERAVSAPETVVLGLITNQPLDVRLGELGPPDDDFIQSVEVFAEAVLYRGGPMMLDQAALSIIHTAGDVVPESAQIGDHDLWLTANWQGASEAVLSGQCTVDQFRFFLGFCLWEEKHLGVDIERNSWFPMSVNTGQLKAIIGVDGCKLPIKEESIANRWSTVMRNCGDVHLAAMSSFPKDCPPGAAELVQEFTDSLMTDNSHPFADLD